MQLRVTAGSSLCDRAAEDGPWYPGASNVGRDPEDPWLRPGLTVRVGLAAGTLLISAVFLQRRNVCRALPLACQSVLGSLCVSFRARLLPCSGEGGSLLRPGSCPRGSAQQTARPTGRKRCPAAKRGAECVS